jgi:hypothetical protein
VTSNGRARAICTLSLTPALLSVRWADRQLERPSKAALRHDPTPCPPPRGSTIRWWAQPFACVSPTMMERHAARCNGGRFGPLLFDGRVQPRNRRASTFLEGINVIVSSGAGEASGMLLLVGGRPGLSCCLTSTI